VHRRRLAQDPTSHELTAETLKHRQDPRRPNSSVTFTDTYALEVGSQTLELDYEGVNTSQATSRVRPKQKVRFFVDVVFPDWAPFRNRDMTEDAPGFLRAHDDVLGCDFDTIVAGHLTRLGAGEDVETQRDYFRGVRSACEAAMRSINWMQVAGEVS
jgi:hypothetical protein